MSECCVVFFVHDSYLTNQGATKGLKAAVLILRRVSKHRDCSSGISSQAPGTTDMQRLEFGALGLWLCSQTSTWRITYLLYSRVPFPLHILP